MAIDLIKRKATEDIDSYKTTLGNFHHTMCN